MAHSPSGFAFDVFLSFRGEDTRKNFTDHLHTALVNARLDTFRDDRLEKGKVIKEELDNAIRGSRSSVIVLSKEYASSTWCLDELVMILQQRKRTPDYVVLPVFYDVDPSHVRKQTGTVENAFTIHQETQSSSQVEEWRTALKEVADLAGMNLQAEADGHESKFVQKIVREIQNKLGRKPLSDVQEVLKKKLRFANQILNVAESNQLNNPTVRESLFDLKEAIYNAEDLLQETKTEVLRQEIEHVYECSTSKAQELISTPSHAFNTVSLHSMLDQVLERLDDITKQTKDVLDSEVIAGSKVSQTIPSTSWVEEFDVNGRDDEKETLVRLLLSVDESSNNITVIPIVGMGGIGKTTLAQLLYNDDRVEHHFDKRAWTCVSEKFDVLRISQEIYESLTLEACNIVNLNLLQTKLKAILKGTKFFLILDDMWNKSYNEWEVLRRPFQFGAHGSKIIVTTRNEDVASMVGTFKAYRLRPMLEKDGWSLFEKHAFKNAGVGAHSDLEEIGRQIVQKCKGLPLAIKSLGGLLCSKLTVREWKSILNSETWELPQEESNILSSLWLSYKDLTLELKRCFGYCSIFSKNYKFKRLDLISLWNAVGLLELEKRKSAEEVGEDYFKDLVSRSFFQRSSTNHYGLESYTMHDLHNDLASFVSGEFCVRLEGSYSPHSLSRTRHVNVTSYMFEDLDQHKCLRTLIIEAKWGTVMRTPFDSLLPKLQCLMVLMLPGYPIEELPDTINNLKHLRQLDLSSTHIRRLPDTICTLYNLQALLLSDCKCLIELPTNFGRLIKLSRLDISRTRIRRLPNTICTLYNLQALLLSDCYLTELPANLGRLIKLSHLDVSRTHIRRLPDTICTLYKLQALLLSGCQYLTELPADLGRLIKLSRLDITDTWKLKRMPQDMGNLKELQMLSKFVLDKDTAGNNLAKLKKLQLRGGLCISGLGHGHSSCLEDYILRDMKFLNELKLHWREGDAFSPMVEGEEEEEEREVLEKLQPHLNLERLKIRGFGGKMLADWSGYYSSTFPHLTELCIDRCPKLSLLPETMHSHLPSLVHLWIRFCPELECYPEGGFPSKLKSLVIWRCKKLNAKSVQKLNQGCLRRLTSLKKLRLEFESDEKVDWSAEMEDEGLFPTTLTHLDILHLNCETIDGAKWFGHLNSLQTLRISHCDALRCLPESGLPTALKTLRIWNCGALQCLPESGLPSSLSRLYINNCRLLEKRCRRETGEDWPKIAHIGDIQINDRKVWRSFR